MASRKVERLDTVAALQIGECYLRATLDTRHANADPEHKYTVVITYYIKGDVKTVYKKLPYAFSKKEFHEMCRAAGKGKLSSMTEAERSALNDAKASITDAFNSSAEALREIARHKRITHQTILSFLGQKHTNSFTEFWKGFNETKNVGTRISYENARKSFVAAVGTLQRPYITADDIKKWEKAMEGLSRTTVGIYERACRAAWNEAVKRKMASRDDNPFGKIPVGSSRKRDWLDVEKMTQLYDIFTAKDYPGEWTDAKAKTVHRAVGMFLFQYLANGCNMADVAMLTYGDDYFRSEGKILTFIRKKTEDRTGTEVVIPITEPLKKLTSALAVEPETGAFLFPNILKGTSDPAKIKAKVGQENKNVNKGLRELASHLGWPESPSGTWARHSFATNLTHAGVPERYISEAMGHTVGGVTSRYIDLYPIEQQMRYNSRLLNTEQVSEEDTVTITRKEYEALLALIRKPTK